PTSSAHLCPANHPPVPLCSVTHLCPEVPPTCAQQCHPPVPTHQCSPAVLPVISAVYRYPSSVSPISAAYQCCILVPPIRDTSLVLSISAAYPCHLISAAYRCRLSVPISAASSTHISEGEKIPV
ncbi:unnamed protein product, partial [Staurois parvus]